jgi:hypothetical protein
MLLLIITLKSKTLIVFIIIFGTLFASKAAFINIELANKACTHLFITLINATNSVTEANLFVYSITAMLCYTFIVFIGIIVNASVFKKSIASYKQF